MSILNFRGTLLPWRVRPAVAGDFLVIMAQGRSGSTLLLRMLNARATGRYPHTPIKSIVAATVGVLYFVLPLDFIPDFIPGLGLTDDLAAKLLDQTKLPAETTYIHITNEKQMHDAIRRLVIRGAPAIGVAAAYGVYLGIKDFKAQDIAIEAQGALDVRHLQMHVADADARIDRFGRVAHATQRSKDDPSR